jgi:clan AA aspartic protease (TIGR02281 family)
VKSQLTGLSLFIAGCVFGWYAHDHWSRQALSPPAETPANGALWDSVDGNTQRRRSHAPPSDGSPPPHTAILEQMLAAGQYQQAVGLLNSADSSPIKERYRSTLIEHLHTLLRTEDYLRAEGLLSTYLNEEYRDADVLVLRARLYWLQGRYREAIETLYEAKSYEHRALHIAMITERLRAYVSDYDRRLQANDQQQSQLSLYEYLVQVEPDHSPYFIALARAQVAQNRLDEARQSLFLVESDPRVSDEARHLLEQINDKVAYAQASPVAIPLLREGEHFLIEAWINETAAVRLLIDTGASMTVVRDDVLRAAGVVQSASPSLRLFNTANGPVEAAVYRLDRLSVGDQSLTNIEVAALELPKLQAADGLLGMNFLKHFKFFLDQNKPELRLSTVSDGR